MHTVPMTLDPKHQQVRTNPFTVLVLALFFVLTCPSFAADQDTRGVDLPRHWSLTLLPIDANDPNSLFRNLYGRSRKLTLKFDESGSGEGSLSAWARGGRIPEDKVTDQVQASFKDMKLQLNITRGKNALVLAGKFDPFSEEVRGTYRNQNNDTLGTFDLRKAGVDPTPGQTLGRYWSLRMEDNPRIVWSIEMEETDGRIEGRVQGRRMDDLKMHYAHIEGTVKNGQFVGLYKDESGSRKMTGRLNGFHSAIAGTIETAGGQVPFRMSIYAPMGVAAIQKSTWKMDYVPPRKQHRVTISPIVTLDRLGDEVVGNASFRMGWCGNEMSTPVQLYGTWGGAHVELKWVIAGNPNTEVLSGLYNPLDGKIYGTVKDKDGTTGFVLSPQNTSADGR